MTRKYPKRARPNPDPLVPEVLFIWEQTAELLHEVAGTIHQTPSVVARIAIA